MFPYPTAHWPDLVLVATLWLANDCKLAYLEYRHRIYPLVLKYMKRNPSISLDQHLDCISKDGGRRNGGGRQ